MCLAVTTARRVESSDAEGGLRGVHILAISLVVGRAIIGIATAPRRQKHKYQHGEFPNVGRVILSYLYRFAQVQFS